MTSPRVMTTHETYNNIAWRPGTKTKYIYLSRNPRDVAVSYYHHISGYRFFVIIQIRGSDQVLRSRVQIKCSDQVLS